MKKLGAFMLSLTLLLGCVGCGAAEQKPPDIKPSMIQAKSICELAVMKCYYHNVAKYYEEDAEGFWLWKKDKHFWIEYSGSVDLGIDTSLVTLTVKDDIVTITIPEARVLDSQVESSSLTKDSFIVAQHSAAITAEDEQQAFSEAQSRMVDAAANNQALLSSAQDRAKSLLESYVKSIGDEIGKQYTIQWVYVGENGVPLQ